MMNSSEFPSLFSVLSFYKRRRSVSYCVPLFSGVSGSSLIKLFLTSCWLPLRLV